MDITLLPPSTILSRHSHLALLPSPFPNLPLGGGHCSKFTTEHVNYPRPPSRVPYNLRKRYEPSPPTDGTSPIGQLPEEILLNIFGYLDWEEIISLRPVCKEWSGLALTPTLHSSLTLHSIPSPLPFTMVQLLRSVRYLNLHLYPYPTHRKGHSTAFINLLEAIPPGQLISLSIPFSAPYVPGTDLGGVLRKIGGNLEFLDLKGSGIVGSRWISWLEDIGKDGSGLRHLDMGFTSISSLPLRSEAFRNLRTLRLASCTYIPPTVLAEFLADLPVTVESLDLSRLDHVSFKALWDMKVVEAGPTCLKEIKVVGIDHLTRRDVRRLKSHWEGQRKSFEEEEDIMIPRMKWRYSTPPVLSVSQLLHSPPHSPSDRSSMRLPPSVVKPLTPPRSVSLSDEVDGVSLNIVHSAILESEDEDGYRQFIGEVANGTTVAGFNMGLGIHLGPERQSRARWVEVDGGGLM